MRHARVLNPRSSVALEFKKAETHTIGSWNGLVFLVVTLETTLVTTELKFPSRIEAVGEAAAAVSEFMNRLGIAEERKPSNRARHEWGEPLVIGRQ